MLMFSKTSWSRYTHELPRTKWEDLPPVMNGAAHIETGRFVSCDGLFSVESICLNHPGERGWTGPDFWHPIITEFLDRP